MKKSIVAEKVFSFSLEIISLYQKMKKEGEYVISKQLLRSSTSIGANIEEALAGQTKKILYQRCQLLRKKQEKHIIGCDYCKKAN